MDMVQFASNEVRPMAKADKRVPIYLTEAQHQKTPDLVEAAGYKSFSELVRMLLKREAERRGVEWPDDANTWGDASRTQKG